MGSKVSSQASIISEVYGIDKDEVITLFKALSRRFPYGSVPRENLTHILNLRNPTGPMIDSLFYLFDIDNDGVISLIEYIAMMILCQRASPEEKILFAFEIYDTDRTGKITKDEVERMIWQLYRSFPVQFEQSGLSVDQYTIEFFSKLDADGDESISREEFLKVALGDDIVSKALQNTINTTM